MPISSHPRLRRLATKTIAVVAATGLLGTATAYADSTGIDVSRWQHGTNINWSQVKADNVTFTFIKATEGTNYTNDYFRGDWAAAKRNGIYRGAYHFARPSVGSARSQARYFVRHAGVHGGRGDLPPVLDLESDGGLSDAALRRWTRTWLETVERRTGRTPIIYTGPYFWESELGNSRAFTSYPLWIAHYSTSSPRVPGGWPRWTFWQKSQTGRINGISGAVDINRFNGTRAQLRALAHAGTSGGDDGTAPGTGTTPTPDTGTPTDPDTGTETPETPETPLTESAVSLSLSQQRAFRGRQVTFSGDLESAAGRPLLDKHVVLHRRADGSSTWSRVAASRTSTAGTYEFSFAVSGSADFKVAFRGNQRYAESTSPVRSLTVLQKVRTRPTLAVDHASRRGGAAKVYGHLRTTAGKPVLDRTMYVYQRLSRSTRWTLVARSRTLTPSGWYQAYVRPSRTATYKAVFTGGRAYTRSISNLTTLRVR